METISHWINGALSTEKSDRTGDVYNPATGQICAKVNFATPQTVDLAVNVATKAFETWRHASLTKRTQVLFAFRELVNQNKDKLAALITKEHGKVLSDAYGEVTRGLEVVEFACGIPHLLKGGFSEEVSTGVDVYSIRQPLGPVAVISPFNFPAMVPMWFFPIAIACGNTVIVKPSEKDPSAIMLVAQLLKEAGLPEGVFNVVHGDKVASYIEAGEKEGAKIVFDGRKVAVDGDGFWLGPTLFDQVKTSMSIYQEEIFGPVLSVIRVKSYDEALKMVNDHQYGNGTAIFTNDGGAARRFQNEVEVGMVGINVPIPVPMAYFSFGGWKNSLFGDSHAHGTEGVHFFTRGKVVTSRWLDPSHGGINLGFPQNT